MNNKEIGREGEGEGASSYNDDRVVCTQPTTLRMYVDAAKNLKVIVLLTFKTTVRRSRDKHFVLYFRSLVRLLFSFFLSYFRTGLNELTIQGVHTWNCHHHHHHHQIWSLYYYACTLLLLLFVRFHFLLIGKLLFLINKNRLKSIDFPRKKCSRNTHFPLFIDVFNIIWSIGKFFFAFIIIIKQIYVYLCTANSK